MLDATRSACAGSVTRTRYQPTKPLAKGPALVQVSVMKEEIRNVGTLFRAVVDPDQLEFPDWVPIARVQTVACKGMRSPTFQPNRSAVLRPTIAPDRLRNQASRWSSGSRNSGYMSRCASGSTAIWAKKFLGSR
jgi:hypothetical protein